MVSGSGNQSTVNEEQELGEISERKSLIIGGRRQESHPSNI